MTSEYDTISAGIAFILGKTDDEEIEFVAFRLKRIVMSMHLLAHGQEDDHAMFVNQDYDNIRELKDFLRERKLI